MLKNNTKTWVLSKNKDNKDGFYYNVWKSVSEFLLIISK